MTDQIEHGRVENALAAILTSDKFAVAPQMSAFLNYVVHETLAGNANRIKAYTVAVDALGKPDAFDPQNDPSVRVLAKRLRSALDNYYLLFPDTPIIVEMKAGSYVPKFVLREDQGDSAPEATLVQTAKSSLSANVGLVPSPINGVSPANAPLDSPNVAHAHAAARNAATAQTVQKLHPDSATPSPGTTTSLVDRISRPAIAMAVASVLLMGIAMNSQSPAGSAASAGIDSVTPGVVLAATMARGPTETRSQPVLGAAQTSPPASSRPAAPVIYVNFPNNDDPLDGQIADTISTVLARFDELDVRRTTVISESQTYWPEEYRLLMSSLSIGDDVRVDAQLLHAKSGRIVHSRTFTIDEENLTRNDLSEIESFAAQLAQVEGPVFKDYELGGQLSERMSCFMSLQEIVAMTNETGNEASPDAAAAIQNSSSASRLADLDHCLAAMSGDNRHQARALIYQTHARLLAATLSEQQDVSGEHEAALKASREAVSLLPFDAGAHTALMMSLKATGDLSQARQFGERALELNPLDQQALGQMSALLEQMGENQQAGRLRLKAATLRAQWSLSAL